MGTEVKGFPAYPGETSSFGLGSNYGCVSFYMILNYNANGDNLDGDIKGVVKFSNGTCTPPTQVKPDTPATAPQKTE